VGAFTVAHSLTLAAATLGAINIPTPLLNTLIALSILFLAPEALRAHRGGTSLTIRHPWLVAFSFGLLHGMGFANGLASLGLERSALVGALLSFNLGIELGQIGFILLALALRRAFRLMEIRWPQALAAAPSYVIGIVGAAWTLQYGMLVFGDPA
jgi:HupE / UreJ protein